MDVETEIKIKLVENKISGNEAARLIGTSSQNFSQKLRRGTLTYAEVERLARALGYKIEWIRQPAGEKEAGKDE